MQFFGRELKSLRGYFSEKRALLGVKWVLTGARNKTERTIDDTYLPRAPAPT